MAETLQVKFDWKRRTRSTNCQPEPEATGTCEGSIPGGSNAAISRRKMKTQRPDIYSNYLELDAHRKKHSYALTNHGMSSADRDKRRDYWANRKREQRKKKKKDSSTVQPQKRKDMTTEEKRKYMAMKKRESRQKLTNQKKATVRHNEAKRRRVERQEGQSTSMTTPSKPSALKSPPSRTTIHRKTAQAKEALPQSPRTYAAVMTGLMQNASPAKKSELEKRSVKRKLEDSLLMSSLQTTMKEVKDLQNEEKRRRYNFIAYACRRVSHYGITSRVSSSLGIGVKIQKKVKRFKDHREFLAGEARKKRKDAIHVHTAQKVRDHWTSEGTSHVVPLKKRVKKGQPLYVLECSYIQAYQTFKAANPNIKIGYVTFIKLKPTYVRHLKALERSVCCCNKCENVQLKLKALNQEVKRNTDIDNNLQINNIQELSMKTLCPYNEPDFPAKTCVDRSCPKCGTAELSKWYSPLWATEDDRQITFDQWKAVEEVKPIKVKGQKKPVHKKIKALRLATSKVSPRELVSKLEAEVEPFAAHLFRARWQSDQFRQSKINMPPKSAVMVADFAENYACSMHDEVQSYHWAQSQVTIHPIMVYVNNTDEKSAEPIQILLVENQEVHLRFMTTPTTNGTTYTWPSKVDESWIPTSDILGRLASPRLQPGRGIKMNFATEDLKTCKQKL